MYDNLEVFILTYNRAAMLKDALKSICQQSATGFDIIVLDNASTDNTAEIVDEIKSEYPNRTISFETIEENVGGMKNFERARVMAKKEWAMLFHDDDLIHPEYIKTAMDALSNTPDAVMASCTFTEYENPNFENWENFKGEYYKGDGRYFAALLFSSLLHNFASTIYKTELLKSVEPENELYGKISDKPYLLDIASHGESIILKDPYIRYRVHPGQDTNTSDTGPYIHEWFALLKCYKKILGNNWLDYYGFLYNIYVHARLKMGYYWVKSAHEKMSFKQFKHLAVQDGIIRKAEEPKLIEKVCKISASIIQKFL